MIEPKILPALTKQLHDQLVKEAASQDDRGETAKRTLAVNSAQPPVERIRLFPGEHMCDVLLGQN